MPSFLLRTESVGSFGERIIWVGVGGALQRLQELEERIRQATCGFGTHKEEREFRPHLTIGRIKKWRTARYAIAERLVGWAETEFGEWTVEYLKLMRSEHSQQGARYSCLARLPLAEVSCRGVKWEARG